MLVLSKRPHGISTEKCRDLCVEFCSNSSPILTDVSKQGNSVYSLGQGFSKFTFKGPNGNYHQRQKVRNNCYYKTCFYKHAYNFI